MKKESKNLKNSNWGIQTKKNKKREREVWGQIKQSNRQATGIPEEERTEDIFEEIIVKNYLRLMTTKP